MAPLSITLDEKETVPGSSPLKPDREAWLPILLAIITFLVYWPSLSCDFVYDGRTEILKEGFITSISNLPAVLSLKVLGSHLILADRPGHLLFLMLIAAISGKSPFGYHLCCNLLHAANVALLFVFLRNLAASQQSLTRAALRVRPALTTVVLIFALHPIAVEAVSAINYSSDLLVTFFTLLTLLSAMAFRPENLKRALLTGTAGSLCALAAVTCKESGLATPCLLIVYWYLFRREEKKGPWLLFLVTALTLSLVFLAARFIFVPPSPAALGYLGGSISHVLLIQPRLWVFMMGKLIWPTSLSADYTQGDVNGLPTQAAFLILTVVVGFQAWLAAKSKIGAFGVAVYWLGLATVSNFMPLYRFLADRFYYLPLMGVSLQLLALLFFATRWRGAFWSAISFLLITLVPLASLNFARQQAFSNEYSLWSETAQVSPQSLIAQIDLGNALWQMTRYDEAFAHYQRALEIDPNNADAHHDLGNALLQRHNVANAIAQLEKAIEIQPKYAAAHQSLGDAYFETHNLEDAIAQYELALQIDPTNANVCLNLGNALAQKGDLEAGMAQFQKALDLNPNNALAHYNLGYAFLQKGDLNHASAQFLESLRLKPDYAAAQENLNKIAALREQPHH